MRRIRFAIPLALSLAACSLPLSAPDLDGESDAASSPNSPSASPTSSATPAGFTPASGTLDPSFGVGGFVRTDVQDGKDDIAYALALQSDGRIVLAGTSGTPAITKVALARYTTHGALDASYGAGGTALSSKLFSSSAYGLALQAGGKLLTGGWTATSSGNSDLLLTRHTATGFLDTSFGEGGHAVAGFTTAFGNAMATQADGKILLAGKTTNLWNPNVLVARYDADGSLDSAWGSEGIAHVDWKSDWDEARAIAIQPDGKILLAGKGAGTHGVLCRLDAQGALDASFGSQGLVMRDLGPGNRIERMAVQADGRIVALGGGLIHRYLPDGKVDSSFGKDGELSFPDYQLQAMALLPDGRLLVAGQDLQSVVLLRLDARGRLDPDFGKQGKLSLVSAIPSGKAFDIALQGDGKILLAGKAFDQDDDFLLMRLLP